MHHRRGPAGYGPVLDISGERGHRVAARGPDVTIEFNGSPMTLGGARALTDRRTRSPRAQRAARPVGACGEATRAKVKHELFQCTVEVITGVCRDVAQARGGREPAAVRRHATRSASSSRLRHPPHQLADSGRQPGALRGPRRVDPVAGPARHPRVHFHVGVPTGRHAIAVVRSLAYHCRCSSPCPPSPYWSGQDTGMASRTKAESHRLAAAALAGWTEFEQLMDGCCAFPGHRADPEIQDCRRTSTSAPWSCVMCDGLATMDEVAARRVAQALGPSCGARRHGRALPLSGGWCGRTSGSPPATSTRRSSRTSGGAPPCRRPRRGARRAAAGRARLGCAAELADVPRSTRAGSTQVVDDGRCGRRRPARGAPEGL